MKKEDYVSLEVAMLLDRVGYSEDCSRLYVIYANGESDLYIPRYDISSTYHLSRIKDGGMQDEFRAPTLQDVQKWLWEKYELLVTAFLEAPFAKPYRFMYCIQDAKNALDDYRTTVSTQSFDSIQKALNEGIIETFKLI